MAEYIKCPECNGRGTGTYLIFFSDGKKCSRCNGRGQLVNWAKANRLINEAEFMGADQPARAITNCLTALRVLGKDNNFQSRMARGKAHLYAAMGLYNVNKSNNLSVVLNHLNLSLSEGDSAPKDDIDRFLNHIKTDFQNMGQLNVLIKATMQEYPSLFAKLKIFHT